MNILQNINFRQPKYQLPAILYPILLVAGWPIIGVFNTGPLETADRNLEKTEYLNPSLPKANINDDGIGNRTESMIKSFGDIQDLTAVENIESTNETKTEEYESRYSDAEFAMLDKEAKDKAEQLMFLRQMEEQLAQTSKTERELGAYSSYSVASSASASALAELDKSLADARLKGTQTIESALSSMGLGNHVSSQDISSSLPGFSNINRLARQDDSSKSLTSSVLDRTVDSAMEEIQDNAVTVLDEQSKTQTAVKSKRISSSYFNSIGNNDTDSNLISAIVDEDIRGVDGSRIRLRLLDDIDVGSETLPKGTYLYATVSGFGSQRIKGTVQSLMYRDRLIKVNLSIYDTDGMEGLYVPESAFRETAKDIAGTAFDNQVSINNGSSTNSFSQWGWNTIQNAYQKTTSAISKSIKKNRAKIKYGTFVYLINGSEVSSSNKTDHNTSLRNPHL